MKNYSLFLFLLIFNASISVHGQPSIKNITFEKLFTIAPSFGEPGHLMDPKAIVTDNKGNIFIGDGKLHKIFMYDNEGRFLKSFGGQGRGPGEFNEVTDLTLDQNGKLLVLDRMSYKMARFDISSGDAEEHLFKDLDQINMTSFVSLQDERIAAVYAESPSTKEHRPANTKIIRIYKFGNSKRQNTYLDIFQHRFNREKPIEQRFGGSLGYHLTKLDEKKIAIVHRVYDGRIFILNTDNANLTETHNPSITEPYYVQFEEDPTENESLSISGVIRSFGPTGSFYYQIVKRSLLLAASDTHLFHTVKKYEPEGDESSLNMEIYDLEGQLLLSQKVPAIINNEVNYRRFLQVDDDHRLYVANFFDDRDPEVAVYQIKLAKNTR